MSHSPNSTQLPPSGRLHRLRSGLALLALTLSLSLATNAFGIVAPTAVDIQSCATEYIQIGDEALTWGELKAHDKAQTSQAFESPAAAKQVLFEAKLAYSPINTGASSYEIKSAQRYEKVTDIASSFKEQTLLHISLSNGQTIQATAGHPFKTREGWRDAVLLKKGGQLLLGGEADAGLLPLPLPLGEGRGEGLPAFALYSERFATITDIREEVKTTAVYNLEVANLHTFFVGVDGVVVHNGTNGHHCYPKYLGGAKKQNLAVIDDALHKQYHRGLDKVAPRQKGKDYYDNLPSDKKTEVLDRFKDYTKAFDKNNGTDLYRGAIANGLK